ncbi:MAG: glycogen synthase GlgA [Micavibrio aeruginosavorus]|uniref:Glycogen synthase n=1 Tax=Micavibrio aeruginosavorus TaxID=349221 RepID=A0A2W5FS59_9BACT|nr:MAG: glycogen synthase GlgA [Micavibrio aeruginosavorus]
MRVLFVTSEIYPFVKTGGLGDVAAALPAALLEENVDIRLLVPGYGAILSNLKNKKIFRKLSLFYGQANARILTGTLNGIRSYVLDCPGFYERAGPYGDEDGIDWPDNHLRFAALCRVAADLHLYDPNWQPQIVHGNDWQCGLISAYLALRGEDRPKSILTIHNIAYQGLFPPSVLPEVNLPVEAFATSGVEFYGKVGFMKAGLHYADKITTVSPTYAKEIQRSEYGCGLEGLLRARAHDLVGILNGIDMDVWNPATDTQLAAAYNEKNLKDKLKNKKSLLAECGLIVHDDLPVFGVISRLVSQKGLDLLVKAAPEVLKMGAGFVILGSGDQALEKQFRELSAAWPAQVFLSTDYDEQLAHKIIAGADVVVIPSRFEPFGLVQLYALRYGTLPIVRNTGGLADSVIEDKENSTGFVFDLATVTSLSEALIRACALYRSPAHWKKRQIKAMAQDFSWLASAKRYVELYQELL